MPGDSAGVGERRDLVDDHAQPSGVVGRGTPVVGEGALQGVGTARLAHAAHTQGTALPTQYRRLQRWWEGLGYPAFAAMAVVYYLMVNKPALWGG